eukprot:7352393-Pyramimonas_sp.AAC.1
MMWGGRRARDAGADGKARGPEGATLHASPKPLQTRGQSDAQMWGGGVPSRGVSPKCAPLAGRRAL